jgi:hypothetical protein
MRTLFFLLLIAALVGCAAPQKSLDQAPAASAVAPDPIEKLVARLSSTGTWQNGPFMAVELPPSAPVNDVVAQIHERQHFYRIAKVTSYQILEIREVSIPSSIPGNPYTAVLIDTNLGTKIVLLQYEDQIKAWWNRVYDD